jgi:hypothetical protein
MLSKIDAIEPIFDRAAHALSTLRRSDGSLVTFGVQQGFRGLMEAVLGSRDWRRSSILKTGSIGFVDAGETRLWTRGINGQGNRGPMCELEWKGHTLLTSLEDRGSALVVDGPVHTRSAQIRRRDEDGKVTLDAKSVIEMATQAYTCTRTLTISADGTFLTCQDGLFAARGGSMSHKANGCFVLGQNCHAVVSKDGQSALIQLPTGEAWRLRTYGLQVTVESVICASKSQNQRSINKILTCQVSDRFTQREIVMRWELQLEDRA